jgi:hypothetical protein
MEDEVTKIESELKFQEYARRRVIEILCMKVLQC